MASVRGALERFPTPGVQFITAFERAQAIKMKRSGQSLALASAFAALLTGILPGCATLGKCGFGGCPGDAEIKAQVSTLLAQYPALEPPNLLQVQSLDHVVYLHGIVDTEYERLLAQSVALQAPGVARVVNFIGLSGSR